MQETLVRFLGQDSPWRRAWQPTLVFLPGESLWTEEPGRLQFMGSKRVGHNWATKQAHARTDSAPAGLKEASSHEVYSCQEVSQPATTRAWGPQAADESPAPSGPWVAALWDPGLEIQLKLSHAHTPHPLWGNSKGVKSLSVRSWIQGFYPWLVDTELLPGQGSELCLGCKNH